MVPHQFFAFDPLGGMQRFRDPEVNWIHIWQVQSLLAGVGMSDAKKFVI